MQDSKPSIPIPGYSGSAAPPPEEWILCTLAYFDLFDYPLTRKEIWQFLSSPLAPDKLHTILDDLVCRQLIFLYNGFYLLKDNPELIRRRTEGNERAAHLLKKGKRIGRFIYQFPFVRAVGVSGSLSKNFADQNADIDFFIITRKNRLWLARTILHLYKKFTFLTGRQHYHCMNYFIDEEALHLEEQNIFTAIEIKTLLPVAGEKLMQDFFSANAWSNGWLPHCSFRHQHTADSGNSLFKKTGEWILKGRMGQWVEDFFFRVSTRRWKRKQKRGLKNDKGIRMGLITSPHFAKSDPGDFQQKILNLYSKRVAEIMEKSHRQVPVISSAK